MSRRSCQQRQIAPMIMPRPTTNNCLCSLPTLVILILIILQFSRCGRGHRHDDDDECCEDRCAPVGNGILFIIALFYLSCGNVGCGTGGFGGYGAGYGAY